MRYSWTFPKLSIKFPISAFCINCNYGITSSTHNWISDFLKDRTQTVNLEGSSSSIASVDSGVPQGSVLAPVLFLIYINDLPDYISHGSTANLFADDSILYRQVNSQQDAVKLQLDLANLQRWEKDWQMEFHPQKCIVLNITNKKHPVRSSYDIHGHTLSIVDHSKYLGIHIHKNLNWNTHINKVVSKANATCSFLNRNLHKCPKPIKELAYKAMVRPIVEYASTVWDPHTEDNIQKLEMIQRRAARFVCKDYSRTSSVTTMLNQLGWQSLRERRAQAKVTMMYKIIHQTVDVTSTALSKTVGVRGHSHRYLVPFARTLIYQKSFFPDTIRLWNSLPPAVVTCTDIEAFRLQVQAINLR